MGPNPTLSANHTYNVTANAPTYLNAPCGRNLTGVRSARIACRTCVSRGSAVTRRASPRSIFGESPIRDSVSTFAKVSTRSDQAQVRAEGLVMGRGEHAFEGYAGLGVGLAGAIRCKRLDALNLCERALAQKPDGPPKILEWRAVSSSSQERAYAPCNVRRESPLRRAGPLALEFGLARGHLGVPTSSSEAGCKAPAHRAE